MSSLGEQMHLQRAESAEIEIWFIPGEQVSISY